MKPSIIKYASLEAVKCPECGSQKAKIDRIKTHFGKMQMSEASLDIVDFIKPEFKEALQKQYAKLKDKTKVKVKDNTLEKLLDGDLPFARLKCQRCGYKWIPNVDTAEADPQDRLAQMGFITIHRKKKLADCSVSILVLINGVLSQLDLDNGKTAIYPTMVKHNRIQFLYNQCSKLGNHVSAMKAIRDVKVHDGENVDVEVEAKFIFG